MLVAEIEHVVAEHSQDYVFVHCGVVALDGGALVLPGTSMSGKSTAIGALLRAGCTYYSDEYAVLDSSGLVHPYPRHIGVRAEGSRRPAPVAPEMLGAKAVGGPPVPVTAVVVTEYDPGASAYEPRRAAAGEGVMRLLENTVQATIAPARCLDALTAAVRNAVILIGRRGGADDFASTLLARLAEAWAGA